MKPGRAVVDSIVTAMRNGTVAVDLHRHKKKKKSQKTMSLPRMKHGLNTDKLKRRFLTKKVLQEFLWLDFAVERRMPKSQFQPPALPGGCVTVLLSNKQSISTKDIFLEGNPSAKPGA